VDIALEVLSLTVDGFDYACKTAHLSKPAAASPART